MIASRKLSSFILFLCSSFVFSATPASDRGEDPDSHRAKKLIEFGWDEPDTAFMRAHIAEMEATPFNGTVFHILYTKADGTRGRFMNECWSRRAFTLAEVQSAIDELKSTKFTRFTDNFLRF